MRRADAAFDAGDRTLAERLYRQVVELDPDQSRAVYRLGQLSRNDEEALRLFLRYTEIEPKDAWGWAAVGDKYLRLEKSVDAKDAYERAAGLAPNAEDIHEGLTRARLRASPGIEPLFGYEGDSDGNRTWRAGLGADAAIRGGFHLGGRVSHANISHGLISAQLDEASIRLEGRPNREVRTDLSLGLGRLAVPNTSSWITPVADLRLRWRSPEGAPAVEVRARRLALGTTPFLLVNQAMRNEAQLSLELPLGIPRIRVGGRWGRIETAVEKANTRLEFDAAAVLPMGWQGEFSVQYHRLGFSRLSKAGYFAPRLVETLEGGAYWDFGGENGVTASIDLGAGIQRLVLQKVKLAGSWKPALRAWGYLAADLSPAVQWRNEAEAYSAPFAPVGVVTSPNWRWFSIRSGILFRLSP